MRKVEKLIPRHNSMSEIIYKFINLFIFVNNKDLSKVIIVPIRNY